MFNSEPASGKTDNRVPSDKVKSTATQPSSTTTDTHCSGISVHKFGGSALSNGPAFKHVAQHLAATIVPGDKTSQNHNAEANAHGRPHALNLVVTTSAMATVTNTLYEIAASAASDDSAATIARLDALKKYTLATWKEACGDTPAPEDFEFLFAQANRLLKQAISAKALTLRAQDTLVALGEQLSAHILVGALQAEGLKAQYVDAISVIYTDGRAGNAVPRLAQTRKAAEVQILPLLESGIIPVIPGFIGQADDGSTVTLGRGGTDLSATTLGAALQADEVILWKDVPGFLTAHPQIVPDARVISKLHVREASELAYFGAKILHPRALIPIRGTQCSVRIRSFIDLDAPGTTINNDEANESRPVLAIAATSRLNLLTITGSGQMSVSAMSARVFKTLAEADISVSMISQASSEHSLCVGVPVESAALARALLTDAFDRQLANQDIYGIDLREQLTTIAVVGVGIAGYPGVSGRLFTALGKRNINIVAIAQGSSEVNISLVVDSKDAAEAQRAIHTEFQLDKIGGGNISLHSNERLTTDVIILGFGLIGRALSNMLVERNSATGVIRPLRIVGIIDRSGYVFDPAGLSASNIKELAAAKESGAALSTLPHGVAAKTDASLKHILAHALNNPVVVDLTAEDTSKLLELAVKSHAHVVLANKRPVAGKRDNIDALNVAAAANGRRIFYEATVGAGLPILDTYAKLVEAGDTVHSIEGCPSGTMGYLFGELGRDTPFSDALRQAMDLGYTEPDPRDDLSGADVARKGLILGRLLGFTGEFDDVQVESLVPADAVDLPLNEFLNRLDTYDTSWAERVQSARARGTVLRYRATATPEMVHVGLVEVPASGSLGSLNGTDNQFTFTTDRYNSNPLVITGPGAGPAVTAAGVLNDVLKAAGEL